MEPQLWASVICAHQVLLAPFNSVLTDKAGKKHQLQQGLEMWPQRCVTQTLVSFSPLLAQQNGPLCCHLWVNVGQVITGANCSAS